jgi:serine protease Do
MTRMFSRWLPVGLALSLLLGAALALPAASARAEDDAAVKDPAQRLASQKEMETLYRESKIRAAIVKKMSPAVVHISVEKTVKGGGTPDGPPEMFDDEFFRRFFQPRLPPNRDFRQRGLGSGTIVDKKGFVLTNNHVVAEADKIQVKLPDGRTFDAKVVGTDPATDLAVVRIDGKDLPVARLGNSDELEVGESVVAIGNPFGLEQTITMGIVSAKGRSSVGLTDYEDFIQTDASINPGNSGGPLMNLRGELVGVNTAIFSRSGGNMGIGFSIPVNQAREIMGSLIQSGKVTRGFLGVVIQDITQDIAGALGVTAGEGVLVANVGANTPAGRSGIKQGDIIVTFNGRAVKTVAGLRSAVASVKPGTSIPAEVLRDGKRTKLNVKIEAQPSDMRSAIGEGGGQAPPSAAPGSVVLGMTLQDLTADLADRLGYSGQTGVAIVEVEPNGAAAGAGVQQGALILSVNRRPVKTAAEVREAVNKAPSGQSVLLLIRMAQVDRFVAVKKP